MERYDLIKCIGEGAQGRVYSVRERGHKTSKRWVMKLIQMPTERKQREEVLREASLLQKMTHPGIVRCRESIHDRRGHRLGIVMENCRGGDLRGHLKALHNAGRRLDEPTVLNLLAQLGLAIEYAWAENKTLHRDIKSENIFMARAPGEGGGGELLLGDFGIARVMEHTQALARSWVGTPVYMSPEVILAKPYSHKADMWALGCVLYELMTLTYAFNAPNLNMLYRKVCAADFKPVTGKYSPALLALLSQLLSYDPNKRPAAIAMLTSRVLKDSTVSVLRHQLEALSARACEEGDLTSSDGRATRKMIESVKSQIARLGYQAQAALSPGPAPAAYLGRPASPSQAGSPTGYSRQASPSRAGSPTGYNRPASPSRAGSPTGYSRQASPSRASPTPRGPSRAASPTPPAVERQRPPSPRPSRHGSPVPGSSPSPRRPSAAAAAAVAAVNALPSPRHLSPSSRRRDEVPSYPAPSSRAAAARAERPLGARGGGGGGTRPPPPLERAGRPQSPGLSPSREGRPVSPMEAAGPHLARAKEAVHAARRALAAGPPVDDRSPAAAAVAPREEPPRELQMSFLSRMERQIGAVGGGRGAAAAPRAAAAPPHRAPAPDQAAAALAAQARIQDRLRALKPMARAAPPPLEYAPARRAAAAAAGGESSRRPSSPSGGAGVPLRRSNSAPPERPSRDLTPPPSPLPRRGSASPPPRTPAGAAGGDLYGAHARSPLSPGAARDALVRERSGRVATAAAAAAERVGALERRLERASRAWEPPARAGSPAPSPISARGRPLSPVNGGPRAALYSPAAGGYSPAAGGGRSPSPPAWDEYALRMKGPLKQATPAWTRPLGFAPGACGAAAAAPAYVHAEHMGYAQQYKAAQLRALQARQAFGFGGNGNRDKGGVPPGGARPGSGRGRAGSAPVNERPPSAGPRQVHAAGAGAGAGGRPGSAGRHGRPLSAHRPGSAGRASPRLWR